MPTQADISARLGESLLRILLFSITDSIVMFDDDGRILLLNSGGEKLFGYSSDEMLGKNFKSLVPLPIQDAHDGHQQLVGTRCDVIAKHKDQSTFRMCLTSTTARSAIELIDQASIQTMRAAAIIKGLRSFVEKRDLTRELSDLGQIVQESLALAFVSAGASGVKVTFKLDRSLRAILVDKIQIQQVLFNLIRNSLEAMLSSERRELTLTTQTWSDSFAEISVEDTGPGLSDEVAKQLFKPFVTSKHSGMGVGLTICQAIVEAHGGRIWPVQSDSSGTIFRFRLPMPKAAGV